MIKIISKRLMLLIFIALAISCVEEFDFEEVSFESVLVVDAVITNEDKQHQIILSRTFQLEDREPEPEQNASVIVMAAGTSYAFREIDPGIYVSDVSFKAVPNTNYELEIITGDGRIYTSSQTQLTSATEIDALYAVRETNDQGVDGISILVDSFDPTGSSLFYRYEYEETFKIIAPLWVEEDLRVVDGSKDCEVFFVPRPPETEICFRTEFSESINQTSTVQLSEDRVSRHAVRFLSNQDYKISHRYSLLARQYVQTEAAYNYFKTLNEFASEGSIFSQVQPGFPTGNISSVSSSQEKVLGFFEVSTVSEKRVFFNYVDFYGGEILPPYKVPCDFRAPRQIKPDGSCGGLITGILTRALVYLRPNFGEIPLGGPYLMVENICGDCTFLGPSTPPDFWIE